METKAKELFNQQQDNQSYHIDYLTLQELLSKIEVVDEETGREKHIRECRLEDKNGEFIALKLSDNESFNKPTLRFKVK